MIRSKLIDLFISVTGRIEFKLFKIINLTRFLKMCFNLPEFMTFGRITTNRFRSTSSTMTGLALKEPYWAKLQIELSNQIRAMILQHLIFSKSYYETTKSRPTS